MVHRKEARGKDTERAKVFQLSSQSKYRKQNKVDIEREIRDIVDIDKIKIKEGKSGKSFKYICESFPSYSFY